MFDWWLRIANSIAKELHGMYCEEQYKRITSSSVKPRERVLAYGCYQENLRYAHVWFANTDPQPDLPATKPITGGEPPDRSMGSRRAQLRKHHREWYRENRDREWAAMLAGGLPDKILSDRRLDILWRDRRKEN